MHTNITTKQNIANALKNFNNPQALRTTATHFLNTLGYRSQLIGNDNIDRIRFERFIETALATANPAQNLRVEDWQSFYQILQVTDKEVKAQVTDPSLLFDSQTIDTALRRSYLFVADANSVMGFMNMP